MFVPSLIQGRIVYCTKPIPDPQGRNPKSNRPFVIITHFDDIQGAASVQGVAITSELTGAPPEHYCVLPTGQARQKHGCADGSAALCTWLENLKPEDLDVRKGFLAPALVRQIVLKVKALRPGVFKSRGPGEPPSTMLPEQN